MAFLINMLKINMHIIQISISTSKFFKSQKEMAEFLNTSNVSKHNISTQCRNNNYGVLFHDYYGDYNIKKY